MTTSSGAKFDGAQAGAAEVRVEPLAPFGAVIRGLEVSGRLDAAGLASLKSYIYQYGVIVLRGQQSPSDDQFEQFMYSFGRRTDYAVQMKQSDTGGVEQATAGRTKDVVLLSNKVVENDKPLGHQVRTTGLDWHTDQSWADSVASFAALEARVVPSWGGETAFANMYAAYDALDPAMRKLVNGLKMLHCLPVNVEYRDEGEEDLTLSNIRPLVVTNPDNGRRALYLSPLYSTRILGLPQDEAAQLREYLIDFATSSRFVLDHRWELGDIAVWDELGFIHCRRPFDDNEPRLMRTINVLVEDPEAPFAFTG